MAISGIRGMAGMDPAALRSASSSLPAKHGRMSIEDTVTLSAAARQAQLPERIRSLSVTAHENPALAEQLARDYAYTPLRPVIDMTEHVAGTGPERYAATGEPVTLESQSKYEQAAALFRDKTSSLYELEKSKGTAAADILDKIFSLINAQPSDFRSMIDWEGTQL